MGGRYHLFHPGYVHLGVACWGAAFVLRCFVFQAARCFAIIAFLFQCQRFAD